MLERALQYGFTLVELMVGLAVAAVLIVAALPSYTAWIQNSQIRTAAESVLNGMQLARGEAVRRNDNVQLALGVQSSWTVSAPNPPPPTPAPEVIQVRDFGAGSRNVTVTPTPVGATIITFGPLGTVVANANASASITQLNFGVPAAILSSTVSRDLRITVSAGGNVRMCDPKVTVTTDPRYC